MVLLPNTISSCAAICNLNSFRELVSVEGAGVISGATKGPRPMEKLGTNPSMSFLEKAAAYYR